MIEGNKGSISMYVASSKLVPNCAVGLCFDMKIEGCAMHRIINTYSCDCKPKGTEEAVLCYSLYLAVKQALVGTPNAVIKSKSSNVVCGHHDGMFFINWTVKGTVTNIRKSLNMAVSVLKPAKLNSTYGELVKNMKGVKRDTFGYVADVAAKSIKSKLTVGVVGNTKMTKEQLLDVLDVVNDKFDVETISGSKNAPSGHVDCQCHENSTEVKVKGWESTVLADYIESKIKGSQVCICDNYLLVPLKESVYSNKTGNLKEQASAFLQTKYTKAGTLLEVEWAYNAMSNGKVCASDAKSGIKNMSMATLKSAITKHL